MDDSQKAAAQAALDASETGSMTFPQIVGALILPFERLGFSPLARLWQRACGDQGAAVRSPWLRQARRPPRP